MEKEKKSRGRPKWIPDKITMERVFNYASVGLTEEQIANNLGISYQTLNERKNEFSDFADVLKRGKAAGINEVANKLFENAMSGNLGAQIFYLKARANWKETNVNELTGPDGNPIAVDNKIKLTINEVDERVKTLLKK